MDIGRPQQARALAVGVAAGVGILAMLKACNKSGILHRLPGHFTTRPTARRAAGVRVIARNHPLTSEQPGEISIASYNVLCKPFATPNRLPHVVPRYLDYDYRWPLIQRDLGGLGSDIICLQEVTVEKWEEVSAFMAQIGYRGVVQKKPHDFHLALFYRTEKLDLVWSEERSRALLAELQIKSLSNASSNGNTNNSAIYIVNVHLEGSPYRPNDRVNQIKHALQRLEHHFQLNNIADEDARIVVVGDFNSLVTDSPGMFLKTGHLEHDHTEAYLPDVVVTEKDLKHPFKFRDVYEAAKAVPPFTRKVNSHGARMDQLWATSNLTVNAVLRPLQPEYKEIVLRDFLPNKVLPSDHLPIGCILQVAST